LTLLRSGDDAAAAVARTLGVPLSPDHAPLSTLTSRLASTAMLIVLDNTEHRVENVGALAQSLVREIANVRIMVTSQVPLHVAGERLFRLASLPTPDAVRLLAERAGHAEWTGPAAEQASQICRELDGNALAIELAAARVDALGLDGLAARLQQRLALLPPGDAQRPSRRNALAAALDWSHDLLGAREQFVLRHLGVFPGSFSLEGAALVLGDTALSGARAVETVLSLVDRSLVSVERGARRRYQLLETTRLFALDRLAAACEVESARARCCGGMRWLFEDPYEESWRTPPREWHARYKPEVTALWAALDWACLHDVESAAALFGASAPLWRPLASLAQVRALARLLADRINDHMAPQLRARFWLACTLSHTVIHPGEARTAAHRAAQL
jgi:predicted ATPase